MPVPEIDPFYYTGYLTDADGTLIDNRENVDGIGLHNWSRFEASVAVAQKLNLHDLARLPVDVHVRAHAESEHHTSDSAVFWTLQQAGVIGPTERFHPAHPAVDLVAEIIAQKDQIYTEKIGTETKVVPGSIEFFEALHALGFDGTLGNLGIGSNARRGDIELFLDRHGFNGLFPPEHIVGKEDISSPKPDPETFTLAAARIGVSRADFGRVAVFGDDIRDTEAAKRSGGMVMHAVTTLLSPNILLAEDLVYHPDFVAQDFHEYRSRFGILG